MELSNEEKVTKLLCQNEIIKGQNIHSFVTSPCNLSAFLDNVKNQPSEYDERFLFIK